jgi:spore maturation protein CgeB
MRILLAGAYEFVIYEEVCAQALQTLGHQVFRFAWREYFNGILGKAERKYVFNGPNTSRLNRDLLETAKRVSPDVLIVWRGTHILPKTLRRIKEDTRVFLVSYNNDDPFSPYYTTSPQLHHRRLWRLFMSCIPHFSLHFAYRPVNVEDFRRVGGARACLLPPYYIPARNRPIELSTADRERFACDIVFVGHYEPDNRWDYIRALADAGFSVKLFGTGWSRRILGNRWKYFGDVQPVRDEEYTKALCGAKVCLSIFSRMNRDTYTRRTFEIPATGAVMLSEYSRDVERMFEEGTEASFFRSRDELIQKATWLLEDDQRRLRIARAGRERCIRDGHDVESRMRQLVLEIERCQR